MTTRPGKTPPRLPGGCPAAVPRPTTLQQDARRPTGQRVFCGSPVFRREGGYIRVDCNTSPLRDAYLHFTIVSRSLVLLLTVWKAFGSRANLAVSGSDQAYRAISTGQLNALPRLHLRPIDVVVFHGSQGRPCFEGGFPLRCLQRLSCPNIATQHCRWHDNWSTSGSFTPVLSY